MMLLLLLMMIAYLRMYSYILKYAIIIIIIIINININNNNIYCSFNPALKIVEVLVMSYNMINCRMQSIFNYKQRQLVCGGYN